jgi:hypothetical protein
MQESLHSEEYYQEEGINSEKNKRNPKNMGDKIIPRHTSDFGNCSRNSGTNGRHSLNK